MSGKRYDLMFWIVLLTGIILGSILGDIAANYGVLSFLNYGQSIGIGMYNPLVVDLSVLKLTFGFEFRLTLASIIGLVLSMLVYKKLM